STITGGGVGGGGAALGGAVYVEEGAKLTVSYTTSTTISGNAVAGGAAGVVQGTTYSGTAQAGDGVGSGFFLKDDVTLDIGAGATLTIADSLGGYAGSVKNATDIQKGGIIKTGEGTLSLTGSSSYTGDTVVQAGILEAGVTDAISKYSSLRLDEGFVVLKSNQSVVNLYSGENAPGGLLDLGGNTLEISYGSTEGNQTFSGQIISNWSTLETDSGNTVSTGGVLSKTGTGILRLGGDSRGTALKDTVAPDSTTFTNNFLTYLYDGTVVAENDGAFGDGMIVYRRTNTADATKALVFGDNVDKIANTIYLYDSTVPMRIGFESNDSNASVELAGRLMGYSSTNGAMYFDFNDAGQTVQLTNTGINASTGKIDTSLVNTITEYYIKKGTLEVLVAKDADTTSENWYSGLGLASTSYVVNGGEGTLRITGDSSADYLVFMNSIGLDSGLMTVTNANAGQTLVMANTIAGQGGINVNMLEATDVLRLEGTITYTGQTLITRGVLDVSNVNGTATSVSLGGLSTADSTGILVAGEKDIIYNSADDYSFSGIITKTLDPAAPGADGVTLKKQGTGTWTLSLASGSNVSSVAIDAGTLALTDSSLQHTLVRLNKGGTLATDGTVELDNFDGSVTGSTLYLKQASELILTSENTISTIAASLTGQGSLQLQNTLDANANIKPWILSGDNTSFAGEILVDPDAVLQIASTGGLGENMTVFLDNRATLDVQQSTTLGQLLIEDLSEITVAQNKTLTLKNLDHASDSTGNLSLSGAGTVALTAAAASDYVGTTTVKNGTLKISGDNTNTTSSVRGVTRLEEGTLLLDYTKVAIPTGTTPTVFNSLWGQETIQVGKGNSAVGVTGGKHVVDLTNRIEFDNTADDQGNPVIPTLALYSDISSFSFSGEISGQGNLRKTGAGTLIVNGTIATGSSVDTMDIMAGTVQMGYVENDVMTVSNMFADTDVTVRSGATLTGYSNEIGSLALYGNLDTLRYDNISLKAGSGVNALTMYAGSLVNIYMQNATNYTNYSTTDGNIQINGGTIHVEVDQNYISKITVGTTLDVMETTNGTLSGNLSGLALTDNVTGKRLVASNVDNTLRLKFVNVDFREDARSTSGMSLASYLNAASDLGSPQATGLYNRLENGVAVNSNLLNELSGEMHLSAMGVQINTQNSIRQLLGQNVLEDHVTQQSETVRGQSSRTNGLAGWTAAFGAGGSVDQHGGATGYDYGLLGGIVGAEIGQTGTPRLGLFYAYAASNADSGNNMGKVDIDENIFGGYLRWDDPFGYGLVTGSFGTSDYDSHRAAQFADGTDFFASSRSGWSGTVYGERGIAIKTGMATIKPYLGLQYAHLQQDAFDETANWSQLGLHYDEVKYNSLLGIIGLKVNRDFGMSNQFSLFGYANYTHEFLDAFAEGDAYMTAFSGQVSPFHILGNDPGTEWFMAGGGGRWELGTSFSLFGSADLQMSKQTTIVGGNAGMMYRW
ncbi:MAG: autotransporter domain-containing protein, partial [Thermoguttaceae bacterium]|nr:autotransporter domain-containing protein [Thermoguttaceae bacterium]